MTQTLEDLRPGDKAKVAKINGAGAVRRRIADMGVVKGIDVEVVRVAPLGDPIDIKVRGYHLSLRKLEASNIEVTKK